MTSKEQALILAQMDYFKYPDAWEVLEYLSDIGALTDEGKFIMTELWKLHTKASNADKYEKSRDSF